MIFIFGPYAGGKRAYAARILGCDRDRLHERCVYDVQTLAEERDDLEALADELSRYDAVIATETGMGVVPADPALRLARERAGELNRQLALRADTVIRLFCGLPVLLKGQMP